MNDWYDYSNSTPGYSYDYGHGTDYSDASYGAYDYSSYDYSYGPYGQQQRGNKTQGKSSPSSGANSSGATSRGATAGRTICRGATSGGALSRGAISRGASGRGAGHVFGQGVAKNATDHASYDEYGWKISNSNYRGNTGKRGSGRGRGRGGTTGRGGFAGQKRSFGNSAAMSFGNSNTNSHPPPAKKKKVVPKPDNCALCDVILNSPQQAEQHYNGKNHLKELRKRGLPITPENTPGFSGTIEFVPPKIEDLPSIEETTAADANQNNSGEQYDPVTQAVLNNALGKLPTKKKKEVHCEVCNLTLTSQIHADSHFSGVKHAKKVVALRKLEDLGESDGSISVGTKAFVRGGIINQTMSSNSMAPSPGVKTVPKPPQTQPTSSLPSSSPAATSNNSKTQQFPEGQSTASMHYCSFCSIYLNSVQQRESHDSGQKHRNNIKKAELAQQKASNPVTVKHVEHVKFKCIDCDFEFLSAALLNQHYMSQLHQKKLQNNLKEQKDS